MDNDGLVDRLVEKEKIETGRVEEAFRNVDRGNFVPEKYREEAYRDRPLPIADESTISAPHMVAINTELLDVGKDSEVLEVGSGSGYQLAILSELTDETVTGVELDEELVRESRERLSNRDAEVVQGDGLDAVEGEFDRILLSCAVDSLDPITDRLKEEGVALAPVKSGGGQILRKYKNGEISDHGRVRFVECR